MHQLEKLRLLRQGNVTQLLESLRFLALELRKVESFG
jgi:hypothetical protein